MKRNVFGFYQTLVLSFSLFFISSFGLASGGSGGNLRDELKNALRKGLLFVKEDQIKKTSVRHISPEDYKDLVSFLPKREEVETKSETENQMKLKGVRVFDADAYLGFEVDPDTGIRTNLLKKTPSPFGPVMNKEDRQEYLERLDTVEVKTSSLADFQKMSGESFIGYDKIGGEWPCYMKAEKNILLLGKKGTEAYDSNNFTPTMIHNNLAHVYLNDPQNPDLKEIPQMLDLAYEASMLYREEKGFAFWLNQPKLLTILPKVEEQFALEWAKRPNHFPLKGSYVNKRADVASDADDTALAYHMMLLNNVVRKVDERGERQKPEWQPEKIGDLFSSYRDMDRKKSYPYNRIHGNYTDTGAFLTWLIEKKHGFWSVLVDLQWDSTGIHGGLNDLDCVVNSNVLNALAAYSELDTPGVTASCNFINHAFADGKDAKTCGIYYPNPYHLHYAASKAFHTGASCLQGGMSHALQQLRKEQLPDGSWPGGSTKEPVQSTLYAINALLLIGDMDGEDFERATRAMRYLLKEMVVDASGTQAFWKEGVFFSGGFLIRDSLIWRSRSYTTSLGLTAISKYLKVLDRRSQH